MTDSPYPPTPGQLLSQIHRPKADAPPSMEIALGYYEAGIWDAHPLVKKVANQVYWDRFNASERAIPQFKALYAAALASSDSDEPVKIDRAQITKSLPIREIES